MTHTGRLKSRCAFVRWLMPFGVAAAFGMALGLPNAAAAQAPVRLLAFGDSLVHGYGLPAGETFPEQLEAALRARGFDVEVINGGNSGDTTAAARARLEWSLSSRPDAALVELGGNDGLRGLDPAATYDNLDAILRALAAQDIPVLLAGMLAPRNLGAEYAAEFDAVFPRVAKARGVLFYPFFLDGVALQPALNQADGFHPNKAGVAVIVERMLPSVIRLIENK
jgi:acyl-CoA thioesterase I